MKIDHLKFHPIQEEVVKICMEKTQNADAYFFHLLFAYFMSKIATMMRVSVKTDAFGQLPCNMYAINLAISGSGKGRSLALIEEEVINGFREKFLQETFPIISDDTKYKLSVRRANRNGTDPDTEKQILDEEFIQAGPMVFGFDSGTTAAVKQMRHKLLLAGLGSMNMEIDEIGSNLLGNSDVLTTYLELYDIGKVKQKLVKHTRDNIRTEDLQGRTPANMLLFGTPTKLLNGSKTEDEFYDMLETGFARRSFFGYSRYRAHGKEYTAEEIHDILTDQSSSTYLHKLSDKLMERAEATLAGLVIPMHKDVTINLLDYRLYCDKRAERFSDYEDMRKAEMKHRYFKTAKLAGTYAFLDGTKSVHTEHLEYAIAMAEASGSAFDKILNRDKNYEKLAAYLCSIGRQVTHADMIEDLPFYKGTERDRKEMISLATACAYRNNSVIRREEVDGIEFFSGKALIETSMDDLLVSYSKNITTGYVNQGISWQQLGKLCTAPNYHWTAFWLSEDKSAPGSGGYRDDDHVQGGCNLAVIDVDGSTSVDMVKMLLSDWKYFIYTTKRHTKDAHRFRVVMPLSHIVELDSKDYKEFMDNILNWLPFSADMQTNQRSRKWLTNAGDSWYHDGELLDVFQFLPKTKKAEERKVKAAKLTSLTALERWFYDRMESGNRNNLMYRYGMALADSGLDLNSIQNNILALNAKIPDPLKEAEILTTVMVSVNRKMVEKANEVKP